MRHAHDGCTGWWCEFGDAIACDGCGIIHTRTLAHEAAARVENHAGRLLGTLAAEGAEIRARGE
jgi:hypothetical protein